MSRDKIQFQRKNSPKKTNNSHWVQVFVSFADFTISIDNVDKIYSIYFISKYFNQMTNYAEYCQHTKYKN